MARKLLFVLALLLPGAALAQNATNLGGVTIGTPGTGQTAQPFTFNCSVSGCASGVITPEVTIVQGNSFLTSSNPLFAQLTASSAAIGSITNTTFGATVTSWGGSALGAMANYGTSPGAVLVPGVNADVTNSITVGTLPALVAGSAIIGKVGIDQTTVGTTNAISIADIGANTVSTGTGAVGTGTMRIAVGTDTATIAGSAPSTVLQVNGAQWGGTAITNVPTAVGTAGTGNTPTFNTYVVGGATAVDGTAWAVGTTQQTPIGCEYTSGGATALSTAHMGAVGCTPSRALLTDKSSVGGTALTSAVSAYGTAPTGTAVEGVNAYVTNTITALTTGSTVNWSASTFTSGSPVVSVPAMWNGTSWDAAIDDANKYLEVDAKASVTTNNSMVAPHICGSHGFTHVTASGGTQLIALSSGHNIYVCDYSIQNAGTATTVYLESATAASCGGTVTQIDMAWALAVNGGEKGTKSYYTGLNTGSGNALCANNSGANTFDIAYDYDQY